MTLTTPRRATPASPWLPISRRGGAGDTVLVCFPPAGAGAGFFRDWSASLPGVRVVPVQIPGREERFSEPPIEQAGQIAEAVAEAIAAEGWERVHLLGYSFGALLAFETALRMEARDDRVDGVIACARAAPQTVPQPSVADLPDGEFLDYVRRLGGLPPELDEAPEFVELLLPVLRADFRANDGYARAAEFRLRCPIATVAGTADPATADGRDEAWAGRTNGRHRLIRIDGGHFFIREKPRLAFDRIVDILSPASHAFGSAP